MILPIVVVSLHFLLETFDFFVPLLLNHQYQSLYMYAMYANNFMLLIMIILGNVKLLHAVQVLLPHSLRKTI